MLPCVWQIVDGHGRVGRIVLHRPVESEHGEQDQTEFVVFPAVDDDVRAWVEHKEKMGEACQKFGPEKKQVSASSFKTFQSDREKLIFDQSVSLNSSGVCAMSVLIDSSTWLNEIVLQTFLIDLMSFLRSESSIKAERYEKLLF